MQTDGTMETMQEMNESRSFSIRKMYLSKRANVIRETLNGYGHDFRGFISEVNSSHFNATKDELLFAESLKWMQENLHTEGNIAELAKALDVSVRKIQRTFAFFAQKSYTTVLLEMRITSAKGYLKEMKNSIGEVAYLVGIKDHAYFSFLFRKHTGATPSEFRLSVMQSQTVSEPKAE